MIINPNINQTPEVTDPIVKTVNQDKIQQNPSDSYPPVYPDQSPPSYDYLAGATIQIQNHNDTPMPVIPNSVIKHGNIIS